MVIKKTKIICTIGPSSWDYDTLKKLAEAGMNVARLNFSHGTHEEKSQQIKFIRQISSELNKPIMILADLQGPKLRLGKIEGKREIAKGETLNLTLNPTSEEEIPIQFDLSPYVKRDQRIYLNDGLVELTVVDVRNKVIVTRSQNSGVISSNKGVNVPDTYLKDASFTSKDFEDAEFALQEDVDYIALSFVQRPDDIDPARNLIKKYQSRTKIMVKIEKKEAVENLEEIILRSEAVMVARGDLAIEIPAAKVPIVQQRIIRIARQHHKPVIVATQMLESMIENPRPTRAEVSDVANAVLDQVDAVMLSAESANGKYPVEAVQTMKDVILSVEENPEYKHAIHINWEKFSKEDLHFNAITSAASNLAYNSQAGAVVVGTKTGRTAHMLSAFRPTSEIIAVVHDMKVYNQLALVWGVYATIIEPEETIDGFLKRIHNRLEELDILKKGDRVVMITGETIGIAGQTSTIRLVTFE
jgi:pyruvate kinase